jgi:hypothetical protein
VEFSNAGQAAAITRALHEAGASDVTSEYWHGTVVTRAHIADLATIRNILRDKGYEAKMESDSLSSGIVWITITDRQPPT